MNFPHRHLLVTTATPGIQAGEVGAHFNAQEQTDRAGLLIEMFTVEDNATLGRFTYGLKSKSPAVTPRQIDDNWKDNAEAVRDNLQQPTLLETCGRASLNCARLTIPPIVAAQNAASSSFSLVPRFSFQR